MHKRQAQSCRDVTLFLAASHTTQTTLAYIALIESIGSAAMRLACRDLAAIASPRGCIAFTQGILATW